MSWQAYEEQIFRKLASQFPDTELVKGVHLDGRISGIKRQVDILARGQLLESRPVAVVDCKCFSRRVDVKVVESFLGMARDVRAHVGVIITNIGFSKAAAARAENDYDREVRLYVVDFDDLEKLPAYRLIYCGHQGVRLAIPHGWALTEGSERIPGIFGWDLIPVAEKRTAAYKIGRWGCISLIPVLSGDTRQTAEALFYRTHGVAAQKGTVALKSESIGAGDITYSRVRSISGEVEFSAMRVSPGLIVVAEIVTHEEHEETDETLLVEIARSMIPLAVEARAESSPSELWAAVASKVFSETDQERGP